MLIQALCSYADQLAERAGGQKIPDGWSEQKVSFEVLLTPEGKIGGILDIRNAVETPQKKGKTKITYSPRTCLLPLRAQVTGICSNTIEHRPLYLFGLNLDQGELKPCDKTNKAKKSHDAFVVHNREFFQDLDSEICHAFYAFLQNWNPESETENPHLKKCGALYKNNYFCFGLQVIPMSVWRMTLLFGRSTTAFFGRSRLLKRRHRKRTALRRSVLFWARYYRWRVSTIKSSCPAEIPRGALW